MPPVRSLSKDEVTHALDDMGHEYLGDSRGRSYFMHSPESPNNLIVLRFDENGTLPDFVLFVLLDEQNIDRNAFIEMLKELDRRE